MNVLTSETDGICLPHAAVQLEREGAADMAAAFPCETVFFLQCQDVEQSVSAA